MMAIILADMVPERRTALFERGWELGEARVISGVHFPTDVAAGRTLAAVVVSLMQQDRRYSADFSAARRELRSVLGLPPR